MDDKKELKCDNCGSKFFYIRIKTNEKVCRKCGQIQKLEKEEEE